MLSLLNEPSTSMQRSQLQGLGEVLFAPEFLPVMGCALVALVMVVCVVRWISHAILLRRAAAADAAFTADFRGSAHALALFQNQRPAPESPRGALYANACGELAFHLLGTDTADKNFSTLLRAAGRIVPAQWQATQCAARRSLAESARWLRSGLDGSFPGSFPALGFVASLLALMGHAGAGTLDAAAGASSLRPLALALLCHVIGRACHRWLARRADAAVAGLEDFSTELGLIFERSFVDYRQPIEALPSLGGMGMTDGPSLSAAPSEAERAAVR